MRSDSHSPSNRKKYRQFSQEHQEALRQIKNHSNLLRRHHQHKNKHSSDNSSKCPLRNESFSFDNLSEKLYESKGITNCSREQRQTDKEVFFMSIVRNEDDKLCKLITNSAQQFYENADCLMWKNIFKTGAGKTKKYHQLSTQIELFPAAQSQSNPKSNFFDSTIKQLLLSGGSLKGQQRSFLHKQDQNTARSSQSYLGAETPVVDCIVLKFQSCRLNLQNQNPKTCDYSVIGEFRSRLLQILKIPSEELNSPPKAHWSICSICQNRRYDLLSIKKDFNMSSLWTNEDRSKTLTKNIIHKPNIFNRLIDFAISKERELFVSQKSPLKSKPYEVLLKIHYENGNNIFVILSQITLNCCSIKGQDGNRSQHLLRKKSGVLKSQHCLSLEPSDLLVTQEIFHQNYRLMRQVNQIRLDFAHDQKGALTHDVQVYSKVLSYVMEKYKKIATINEETFKSTILEKELIRVYESLTGELEQNKSELSRYRTLEREQTQHQEQFPNGEVGMTGQSFSFEFSQTNQEASKKDMSEFKLSLTGVQNVAIDSIPSERASMKMQNYYSKFLDKSVVASSTQKSEDQSESRVSDYFKKQLFEKDRSKYCTATAKEHERESYESSMQGSKIKEFFLQNSRTSRIKRTFSVHR